jgi:hypothetical protein
MNDSIDRWRPLTERDLTQEILQEINQDSPNISALRTWIIGQFSDQNPKSQINGFESSPQGLLYSWLW